MINIIIIIIVVYFIFLFIYKQNEKFTQDEMKNYATMLKVNCDDNTKIYNNLIELNKEKCYKKGKTEKDTINNNTVCYDNIGKEIISKFNMESNCAISNMINKSNIILDNTLSEQVITKPIINISSVEGPEFINVWNTSTYDTKQTDKYFIY